jgi:cell division protein FtsL
MKNTYHNPFIHLILAIGIFAISYSVYEARQDIKKLEDRCEKLEKKNVYLEQQVDSINKDLIDIFD